MDLYKGMDQLRDLSKLYMDMKTPQVQEETAAPEQVDERAKEPYAIGMAQAMKQTGDTPPLEKSTIKKAHKIAKAINTEEVELVDELYKGKHGQSEKEYQDSRSDAGKMISGDSKRSGAAYSSRGVQNSGPNPAGGSERPKAQGRMGSKDRAYLQYRKANMKKDVEEGIDFKGAAREQARRDAEEAKKDKEVPTNKERRLALGRFRPGRSSAERAEGGRDALKQKGKVPTKGGKPMFDNFEIMADYLIGEGQVQSVQEASEFLSGAPQEFLQDVLRFAEQRMLFMSYLVETGHCADLTEAASVYVESDPELVKDVIDSIIAD